MRYLASAAVAVVLVWAFDHEALLDAFSEAWPDGAIPPMAPLGWVLLGLLVALGLISYFLHRLIHRPLARIILLLRPEWEPPTCRELDFARSIRRGQQGTPAGAVQNDLDLLNAATHFFYCSAVAPIILLMLLAQALDRRLELPWYWLLVVLGFFICGLLMDLRAAECDVAAWHEFPNARGGGPRPRERRTP